LIALVLAVSGATVASTRDVFFDLSFGGFLAFSIWVLVTSIMMFVRMGEPSVGAVSTS